jgi:hypothetical protein
MSSTRNFDSGDNVAKKTTGEKERCDKSTCVQQIELIKKCSDNAKINIVSHQQVIGPFTNLLDEFKTDMRNVFRGGKFITVPDPFKVVHLRGSVHFGRYGYGLLMKNFSLGLYIFLNIPPKYTTKVPYSRQLL